MKWIIFVFILLIPTILASESISINTVSNFSFEENISLNNSSEVIKGQNITNNSRKFVNESVVEKEISDEFFNTLSFSIFSLMEGSDYSFDLFEFLLSAWDGVGEEYNASFFWDEQSSPNSNSQGNEYSSKVGGYDLFSSPVVFLEESYCGDGTCDSEEDCSTCPEDCGECESSSSGGSSSGSSTIECMEGYEIVGGICVEIKEPVSNDSGVEEEKYVNGSDANESTDLDEGVDEVADEVVGGEGRYFNWILFVIGFVIVLVILLILFKFKKKKKKKRKKKRKTLDEIKKMSLVEVKRAVERIEKNLV